jgi:transglutaminase-like putative cysteine protease
MRLRVKHKTAYRSEDAVTYNVNETHLHPRENEWQQVHTYLLKILPAVRLRHYSDFYLNMVHFFDIPAPHRRLDIEVELEVETSNRIENDAFPYGFSHADLPICRELEVCYEFLQDSTYVKQSP